MNTKHPAQISTTLTHHLCAARMSGNTYQVVDAKTDKVMGTYTEGTRARRRADKLDLAYGAVRYSVKIIWGGA